MIIQQLCFRMSRALAAHLIIAVAVGSKVLPTANHEASDVVCLSHANFEGGVTNLQRSSPFRALSQPLLLLVSLPPQPPLVVVLSDPLLILPPLSILSFVPQKSGAIIYWKVSQCCYSSQKLGIKSVLQLRLRPSALDSLGQTYFDHKRLAT